MLEVKTDFLEKELNVIKHVDEHYGEDLAMIDSSEELGQNIVKSAVYLSVASFIVCGIGVLTRGLAHKAAKEVYQNMDNDQELQELFKELDDARNELYS